MFFLKKSSLCLCLCTLTSLSLGDTVWAYACRDAWLTREGEKQRQRLLYCKYVSVKYWCVLDDSLELTFSPFSCIKVFSCKGLPSFSADTSFCIFDGLTFWISRGAAVCLKSMRGVYWNDSCGGGSSSSVTMCHLTAWNGTLTLRTLLM